MIGHTSIKFKIIIHSLKIIFIIIRFWKILNKFLFCISCFKKYERTNEFFLISTLILYLCKLKYKLGHFCLFKKKILLKFIYFYELDAKLRGNFNKHLSSAIKLSKRTIFSSLFKFENNF